MGGAENTRTIIFPNTVRHVDTDSFKKYLSLQSVILNEGLERLRDYEDDTYYSGAFSGTQIKQITLPSTLKILGNNTF